jgi:hypothetical protein
MIYAGDWQQKVRTATASWDMNQAFVQLMPYTRSRCMGFSEGDEFRCLWSYIHATLARACSLWHSIASAHEISARMHVEYID